MTTQEIPKHGWKDFFADLSKNRFEWQVRVEIFNDRVGHQILDEGLPLNGITAETHADQTMIEIMVGQEGYNHQTHSVKNPTKVAYFVEEETPGGIVEIEEIDGTKTLVYIIKPMPLVIKQPEEIAALA